MDNWKSLEMPYHLFKKVVFIAIYLNIVCLFKAMILRLLKNVPLSTGQTNPCGIYTS